MCGSGVLTFWECFLVGFSRCSIISVILSRACAVAREILRCVVEIIMVSIAIGALARLIAVNIVAWVHLLRGLCDVCSRVVLWIYDVI